VIGAMTSVADFREWLDRSGRGYLAEGLGHWPVGEACLEIFRRAGVRGISGSDLIHETLPMARDIIAIRCKPRRGIEV
jgi:hypothetical protein